MALFFLLLVLFVIVLAIAAFVFPPTKWLEFFYGTEGVGSDAAAGKARSAGGGMERRGSGSSQT